MPGPRLRYIVWPVALNPAALRVRRQADPFDAVVTAATIRHRHYGQSTPGEQALATLFRRNSQKLIDIELRLGVDISTEVE